MATDSQLVISNNDPIPSCQDDPNFATVCSFIEHFGEMIGISEIVFDELQQMIESKETVPYLLIRLHTKLFRKYFKTSVPPVVWESWLVKFANSHHLCDIALDVQKMGYQNLKPEAKLELLKSLLEAQFDCDRRFKLQVNAMDAGAIRQRPLGRDKKGQLYWCQVDSEANLRVCQENLEEQGWKTIISRKEQIDELVEELQN